MQRKGLNKDKKRKERRENGLFYKNARIPKHLKGHLPVGPGGVRCACCFDAPGEGRRKKFRAAKRNERQQWKKELDE